MNTNESGFLNTHFDTSESGCINSQLNTNEHEWMNTQLNTRSTMVENEDYTPAINTS